MKKIYDAIIDSPLGKLGITLSAEKLTNIDFLSPTTKTLNPSNTITKNIVRQLQTYFANPQHNFAVPMDLQGTPFQKQVWSALQSIPLGTTLNYGALAKKLKTSARAIGNACRRNPIPIVIPCHRVVAVNHLGGYAGATRGKLITTKHWLLKHEGYWA